MGVEIDVRFPSTGWGETGFDRHCPYLILAINVWTWDFNDSSISSSHGIVKSWEIDAIFFRVPLDSTR